MPGRRRPLPRPHPVARPAGRDGGAGRRPLAGLTSGRWPGGRRTGTGPSRPPPGRYVAAMPRLRQVSRDEATAPIDSLHVRNTLLFEVYDDQRNIMRFVRFPEETRETVTFDGEDPEAVVGGSAGSTDRRATAAGGPRAGTPRPRPGPPWWGDPRRGAGPGDPAGRRPGDGGGGRRPGRRVPWRCPRTRARGCGRRAASPSGCR